MFFGKSIFQIVIGAIAIFFMARGSYKFFYGEKNQTPIKFILLVAVWGGVLIFSLFPDITRGVSRKFGFGENLNTLIFIGFVIVFAVQFKMLSIIERIERNISEIVRNEALSKRKDEGDK